MIRHYGKASFDFWREQYHESLKECTFSYLYLLDSWISSFGEDVSRHVPATSAMVEELLNKTERLYILTKNPVQDEGYLSNLELNVLQAGPIHIQVIDTNDKKIFLVRFTSYEPLKNFPEFSSTNQWTETKPDPNLMLQCRSADLK